MIIKSKYLTLAIVSSLTLSATAYATPANTYFNQGGHIDSFYTTSAHGKMVNSGVNFLNKFSDHKNNIVFYQLSYHQHDHNKLFTGGIGNRHFFYNNSAMLGLNTFVDGNTKGSSRVSIGGEAGINNLYFSANAYEPMRHLHSSTRLAGYDVRAAQGFDVNLKAYLPCYPALSANFSFSRYYGDVAIFNPNSRVHNPDVYRYGITYRPISMVSMNVNRVDEQNGQEETQLGLAAHYRFGVPFAQQVALLSNQFGDVAMHRYDFVDRNYTMPLLYSKHPVVPAVPVVPVVKPTPKPTAKPKTASKPAPKPAPAPLIKPEIKVLNPTMDNGYGHATIKALPNSTLTNIKITVNGVTQVIAGPINVPSTGIVPVTSPNTFTLPTNGAWKMSVSASDRVQN